MLSIVTSIILDGKKRPKLTEQVHDDEDRDEMRMRMQCPLVFVGSSCASLREDPTIFQETVFRLWLALSGVRCVAHTDHVFNAAAPSAGAGLILGATLNNVCGKRTPWYADHVLQHDYNHASTD